MKRFLVVLLSILVGIAVVPAQAELKIFACEPEWAALAQELGGDRVSAYSATTARQDPHRIEARPSLIARLRQADLLVCTGAELESGWLPVLLRSAGNARVQPGRPGHFQAAAHVPLMNIPASVDRTLGDVHASGNPHLHTDPRRLGRIAAALAARLAEIDPANGAYYRGRHDRFSQRWNQAMLRWERRAAPLKGMQLVSHHRDWIYLYDWLGIENAGVLEPKPGLPPSPSHLARLKEELARNPARAIIRTPYQDARPSAWLADQTGLRAVELPYTVGGSEGAVDLFGLFEDTLDRLLEIAP